MKSYNEIFLTGCDEKHEWFLEWFVGNYKKYINVPLVFANFGISRESYKFVRKNVHAIMDMTYINEQGWFKKPASMLNSPSNKTIWIDLDCEIRSDISSLFNMLEPNKLNMVEDKPWSQRRRELWHNSGLVGFVNKPPILYQWAKAVKLNPSVGDQEVLHSILNPITKIAHINDLPNEYNVMRLQTELDNYNGPIKVMHWTGAKGKDKIRSLIDG
tara:strand:- start:156 stop:800 length:645 start_codon:yes stop_codon:yes gene_type:complete